MVVKALWELINPYLIAKLLKVAANVRAFGEWAVVTGATDGIGKGYAQVLAERGLNVLLISRTQSRLDETAEEIRKICPKVEVKTVQFDFGTTNLADYDRLEAELKDLDVAVLVNNVGAAYDYPEFFHNFPGGRKGIQQMIQINCTAATLLTHIVLPKLLEKGMGAIINISSASAFYPTPLIGVYSATKSYLDFFTRSLQEEYAHSGVIFQNVLPFFVATKLAKLRRSSLFAPSPLSYAKSALNTLGVQSTTVGCFPHGLQLLLVRLLPQWVLVKFTQKMMSATRAKALEKRQKTN